MRIMYRTENKFGHGQVDEAEARRVFETWPRNTPEGHLIGSMELGFTAFAASERGGVLMGTTYTPFAAPDGGEDA